jgi:hypothetical protein
MRLLGPKHLDLEHISREPLVETFFAVCAGGRKTHVFCSLSPHQSMLVRQLDCGKRAYIINNPRKNAIFIKLFLREFTCKFQ